MKNAVDWYLQGLIQARKANLERMEEVVGGARYETLQYLVSEARWDHQAVLDRLACKVNELIGDPENACLLLDESYFAKKGTCSAGVARQWNGRLGKVDNSQVGVFASLANGNRVCPIDSRLYLPHEWTDNIARMQKAHIPEEHQVFKTKHRLALELIDRAIRNGLQFGWIAADGFYGHSAGFLWELEKRRLTYAINVHSNDQVYVSHPQPYQPKKKGNRGRDPLWRSQEKSFPVDSWTSETPDWAWKRFKVRNTTVGELWFEAISCNVWMFNRETGDVRESRLVVTRDPETREDVKYTLCNAGPQVSLKRIVHMIAQRFWVERGFQESKENTGMAQYQVRGWLGWHRHMTLVMMAQLFMLELKVKHASTVGLLSCADIKEVLVACLIDRRTTPGEAARQLRRRHEKRRISTARRYRAKGQEVPEIYRPQDSDPER